MPDQESNANQPPPGGDPQRAENYVGQLIQLLTDNKLIVSHTDLTKYDPSNLQDHYRIDVQNYQMEVSHSKQPTTGKDTYVLLFINSPSLDDFYNAHGIIAYLVLSDDQFKRFKAIADEQIETRRKVQEEKRFAKAIKPVEVLLEKITKGELDVTEPQETDSVPVSAPSPVPKIDDGNQQAEEKEKEEAEAAANAKKEAEEREAKEKREVEEKEEADRKAEEARKEKEIKEAEEEKKAEEAKAEEAKKVAEEKEEAEKRTKAEEAMEVAEEKPSESEPKNEEAKKVAEKPEKAEEKETEIKTDDTKPEEAPASPPNALSPTLEDVQKALQQAVKDTPEREPNLDIPRVETLPETELATETSVSPQVNTTLPEPAAETPAAPPIGLSLSSAPAPETQTRLGEPDVTPAPEPAQIVTEMPKTPSEPTPTFAPTATAPAAAPLETPAAPETTTSEVAPLPAPAFAIPTPVSAPTPITTPEAPAAPQAPITAAPTASSLERAVPATLTPPAPASAPEPIATAVTDATLAAAPDADTYQPLAQNAGMSSNILTATTPTGSEAGPPSGIDQAIDQAFHSNGNNKITVDTPPIGIN